MYYLDTNIISYALKGSFPAVEQHFRRVPAPSIVIPSIVLAELEYGARKSANYDKTISEIRKFTDVFQTAPFSAAEAKAYGEIRASVERAGTPIGPNDLIVAATCKANNGILVTHNVSEFSRVPGLLIEDWTV